MLNSFLYLQQGCLATPMAIWTPEYWALAPFIVLRIYETSWWGGGHYWQAAARCCRTCMATKCLGLDESGNPGLCSSLELGPD